MAMHQERLVEYKMGAPTELVEKDLPPGIRKLVLVAHDESTNTANDGLKASWVLDGEQPILKKGAGCGSLLQLHVIQLRSLNSGPILSTNSKTCSQVPHLYDPVSFHF